MTRKDHREGENFKKNHPNTGQKPSKIDRNKARTEMRDYWKRRAEEEKERKQQEKNKHSAPARRKNNTYALPDHEGGPN